MENVTDFTNVGEPSVDKDDNHCNVSNRTNKSTKNFHQGHSFVKKNLHKPATCHHCSDMLWGILGTTGMICEVCNFLAHEKCMRLIVSPCTCIVPFLIKDPVPHCWSQVGHYKRKYCNVCRKRVDDLLALRCEICEYYAHYECLDFASTDCKQCALSTMVPLQRYPSLDLPLSRKVQPESQLTEIINPEGNMLTVSGGTYRDRWTGLHSQETEIDETHKVIPVGSCTTTGSTTTIYLHHWREGNLPVNSKCSTCRKTCWSSECLTGMRCEWCGITAHSLCHTNLPTSCDFGSLRDIMLPPDCVRVPRTSSLIEHIIGMSRPQLDTLMSVQSLTDEFSSSGDSPEESGGTDRRSNRVDKLERDFDDYVRMYDGLSRYRRRQCRYLSLGRSVSVQKVIELSLKAFQLPPDESNDYYLVEIDDKDGLENMLSDSGSFKSQLKFETRRPQILLQYCKRSLDQEYISVFTGYVGQTINEERSQPAAVSVPINCETTVQDVISLALQCSEIQHLDATKLQLVETVLDRGLTERVMPSGERVWALLKRIQRESVRALRLTRFYLQPHESTIVTAGVSIFVGNLKKGLTQRLYERILLERLGVENKWDSIEVIYYDFGSLVIVYANPERADEAYQLLKQATFEDRPVLALILPRLVSNNLPPEIQPLLVLVNVKSGGCQGIELITSFRKLLNPHQVFNLDHGGPLPGLHCFRRFSRFKILVCGGDGTVGWALSCLDNVRQDAACPTPPMAILPLGTGNDLARVLRWGSGYTGAEEPLTILRDVVEAEKIRLDRWTVVIKPDEAEKDTYKKQMQIAANVANTNEDTSRIFVMNNYFGLGIDADLNLDFHMAREENPAKFNSRIHNKSVYLKMGLRKMVNRTKCKDLHQNILVEVDGKQLDLPPLEGIIILNILSWGAGANPWGMEKDDTFSVPNHYDGLLEVVGVTGVVHMGQIFSGLRTGTRLAQGGHIRITIKSDIPVQVDGEPWIQAPGQIIVLRSALKATMLKKRKRLKVNRRHTEPGLGVTDSPTSGCIGPDHPSGTSNTMNECTDSLSGWSIFGASGPPPVSTSDNTHRPVTNLDLSHPKPPYKGQYPQLKEFTPDAQNPSVSFRMTMQTALASSQGSGKTPLISVPSDPLSSAAVHNVLHNIADPTTSMAQFSAKLKSELTDETCRFIDFEWPS